MNTLATSAEETIAVDDTDHSSDAEDDGALSSSSVASSVRAYRSEHGHRYHAYKEGSYAFPNDDIENDRLELQHNIFLKTLDGRLHLAPINKGLHNVLDVGTGTGIWAIEFADEFPSAKPPRWLERLLRQCPSVPPNLTFLIDDAETTWEFSYKFDYIHGRALLGSFGNWPRFFEQSYQNLEPGGWLEMQDIALPPTSDDGTLTEEHTLYKWGHLMVDAANKIGRSMTAPTNYKTWMEEAGFVDVQEFRAKWPQNGWAKDRKFKELGQWNQVNLEEGLHGFTMALFTRVHGWSKEQVEEFLPRVRSDIRNRKIHAYWQTYGNRFYFLPPYPYSYPSAQ
ncbi:hypothetical protein FGG08_004521 [Glutinoglossum americanum]|uniref:S-adenosyl-L-methionine-dependent methyltransferase n=1 Tax=Glutinoglossum americanum TaxID=1670608 RepID=A0A9P8IB94_9PEZI|nr:hypothetical protein FGG08_004521 [Glutinoglossum americanum]